MDLATARIDARSDAGCDADDIAEVTTALASPSQIEIVRLLADQELDITEIVHQLGASIATTSHHLGPLRRARLVTSRQEGTRIINRLAGPDALDLCTAACATAHQHPRHGTPNRR